MTTVLDQDKELFQYFEQNAETYIQQLAEFVAIPSISAEGPRRPDVVRAIEWYQGWCEKLGGHTTLRPLGKQTLPDGTELDLPPVLLAEFPGKPDPSKKTLVVYGHLDVQPAAISDGWDTDPFVLTEKDGKLFGRGATDDKGPTTAWLWVIEAYQKLGRPLPVNIRCVFEVRVSVGLLQF
jgi:nonspecific dipeptidase